MSFPLLSAGCLTLAICSALVAGVFQAFSDFVMAGLARTKGTGGMESMQHINLTVMHSLFLKLFLAIVPVSLLLALYAVIALGGLAKLCLVLASLVYICTVFAVTIFGNVPMNNHLANIDAASDNGAAYWQTYASDWTRLNHVRTAGCIATAGLYAATALVVA